MEKPTDDTETAPDGSEASFVVVDPRLSAGRGVQFSAGAGLRDDGGEWTEEDAHCFNDTMGRTEPERASIHTPISQQNVGFKLLQKMGWKEGAGLGRNEDGIVAPVKPYQESGENTRLGVGKIEQDEEYTNADKVSRKKLEVEIQADEDEDRVKRREDQVIREQKIKEDVQAAKQKFFCQICHKQYQTIMEWEAHLSSYDHHHKKRLSEMKAMVSGRTKRDRMRREQKQLSKEMANLAEQSARARQQEAEPIKETIEMPVKNQRVELPVQRNAIHFGFGGGISMKPTSTSRKRPPPPTPPHPSKAFIKNAGNLAAFGSDTDEDVNGE